MEVNFAQLCMNLELDYVNCEAWALIIYSCVFSSWCDIDLSFDLRLLVVCHDTLHVHVEMDEGHVH